jgi:hypothetical protein
MGFKIISEKGVPTFVTSRSSPTTIDLTWANSAALKFIHSCSTSSSNHGSDHQAICLRLNFESNIQINERLSYDLKKFDAKVFQAKLLRQTQSIPSNDLSNADNIDTFVKKLTIAIQNSADKQKKTVNHNKGKIKPCWDKIILDPIINKRNRARKWMLLSKSPALFECYRHWQATFKESVATLKKNHWRKFLAECKDTDLFKAYRYTKPNNSNSVAPLLDENDNVTTNKEEQATLLFKGTSDVPINITMDDIQPFSFNPPFHFPAISPTEIKQIINNISKEKG